MPMPIGRTYPVGECGHTLAYGSRTAKLCIACYKATRAKKPKHTPAWQGSGRRKTKFLTLGAESKHITEWAVTLGCSVSLIARFLSYGITFAEVKEKITTGATANFHPWRKRVKPLSTLEYKQIMESKKLNKDGEDEQLKTL